MPETTWSVPIKADLRPAYYDDFHCLAAACRQSCCVGWRITFNKKDYLSLKRQAGTPELNERMQRGLRRVRGERVGEHTYGEFTMEDSTCALLRPDGLCQLQLEKGPAALPDVCQTFPRKDVLSRSSYREYSLTPACEGVLELLWNLPEGIDFRSDPIKPGWTVNIKMEELLTIAFQSIRSQCIDFLQDRRFSLPERILLMGMSLKELADGETDLPAWLARARALPEQTQPGTLLKETEQTLPLVLANNTHALSQLATTNQDFAALRAEILHQLTQTNGTKVRLLTNPYRRAQERYAERFPDRAYFMENLLVAVFFHLQLPVTNTPEELWRSYVNFCNLYAFYRFMAVMSCREGAEGNRNDLFRSIVHASRGMLHNSQHQAILRDEYFKNDSATLAHMALLLGG